MHGNDKHFRTQLTRSIIVWPRWLTRCVTLTAVSSLCSSIMLVDTWDKQLDGQTDEMQYVMWHPKWETYSNLYVKINTLLYVFYWTVSSSANIQLHRVQSVHNNNSHGYCISTARLTWRTTCNSHICSDIHNKSWHASYNFSNSLDKLVLLLYVRKNIFYYYYYY